eukprot:TRINITY_DN197_c0_g2_i1.p1 TRINITY_DN197_c0_g2~~TRINITY_DN197_c0_g2_i1.p1  ORF type:complete len:390 (-),score=67.38 TRINITY_DN197_c0_g2_i1:108-1277(-)
MSSIVVPPTLPISKKSLVAPNNKQSASSPSKVGGNGHGQSDQRRRGKNKATRPWADYTPTPWMDFTPTPWAAEQMAAQYAFGHAVHGMPFMAPLANADAADNALWPSTPTPSGGGGAGAMPYNFRTELIPPPPISGGGLPLHPPPRVAAMAAAAAAAAAGAAAAAANACEVTAVARERDGWQGLYTGDSHALGNDEMRTQVKNTFIHVTEDGEDDDGEPGLPGKAKTMPDVLRRSRKATQRLAGSRGAGKQDDLNVNESSKSEVDATRSSADDSAAATGGEAEDSECEVEAEGDLLSQEADLPSVGSAYHGSGKCRPCAWFWKPQKCQNERDCVYCHLCPEGELKSRKKAKVDAMRAGALMPVKKESKETSSGKAAGSGPRVLKLSPVI